MRERWHRGRGVGCCVYVVGKVPGMSEVKVLCGSDFDCVRRSVR